MVKLNINVNHATVHAGQCILPVVYKYVHNYWKYLYTFTKTNNGKKERKKTGHKLHIFGIVDIQKARKPSL